MEYYNLDAVVKEIVGKGKEIGKNGDGFPDFRGLPVVAVLKPAGSSSRQDAKGIDNHIKTCYNQVTVQIKTSAP